VQLSNLPALRVLDLSHTRIQRLEVNGLPALEQLDLHGNRLGKARLNALAASLPEGCHVRV
jgi:hypothetical protein